MVYYYLSHLLFTSRNHVIMYHITEGHMTILFVNVEWIESQQNIFSHTALVTKMPGVSCLMLLLKV